MAKSGWLHDLFNDHRYESAGVVIDDATAEDEIRLRMPWAIRKWTMITIPDTRVLCFRPEVVDRILKRMADNVNIRRPSEDYQVDTDKDCDNTAYTGVSEFDDEWDRDANHEDVQPGRLLISGSLPNPHRTVGVLVWLNNAPRFQISSYRNGGRRDPTPKDSYLRFAIG